MSKGVAYTVNLRNNNLLARNPSYWWVDVCKSDIVTFLAQKGSRFFYGPFKEQSSLVARTFQ